MSVALRASFAASSSLPAVAAFTLAVMSSMSVEHVGDLRLAFFLVFVRLREEAFLDELFSFDEGRRGRPRRSDGS